MPDEDLLERLEKAPSSGGDVLQEILAPKVGGDAKRLQKKLGALWDEQAASTKEDSVERMQARNAALRLSKGDEPRTPDGGKSPKRKVKRLGAYWIEPPGGEKMRLSLCLFHRNRLQLQHPAYRIKDATGRVKKQCEACTFKKDSGGD